MKKRSFIAILMAAMLLAGCSSQENNVVPESTGATESGAASTAADTGADSGDPAGASATSSTAGTAASTASSGTSAAESSATTLAPSVPETKPADATVPAEPSDKPAATAAPEKTSDPVGADYTGKDIGGSPESADSDSGFVYDIAETDGFIMEDAAAAVDGAYGAYDVCPPIIDPGQIIPPEAGLLTGGEWKDNENWDFWQGLYTNDNYGVDWGGYLKRWRTEANFRVAVTVMDSAGNKVSGAEVKCDSYTAVTDNKGRAYLFFAELINGPTEFTVTYNGGSQKFSEIVNDDCELEFTLDSEAEASAKTLDLMIMCDTTGSMGDELEYLKEELEDVVTRIRQENGNIPTRLSVNFYRDEGDEYVVREFPFTTDLDAVVNAIAQQSANGGGDTPEAVHTALDSALNGHNWDENSVKIMFLVLDAPPHEDMQIIDETVKLVRQAAEKGIRIVPVAASGVDKSCEYLLRSMAFMTGGTYTFLTDDSGIGFGHEEPTVGSYDVEKLNDMMVRICGEYLA